MQGRFSIGEGAASAREMASSILTISVLSPARRQVRQYAGAIAIRAGLAIFHRPQHPYTAGLLASLPRLDLPDRELTPIGGIPPRLYEEPVGCAFAPRCQYAIAACSEAEPTLQHVNESFVACGVLPMAETTTEASR